MIKRKIPTKLRRLGTSIMCKRCNKIRECIITFYTLFNLAKFNVLWWMKDTLHARNSTQGFVSQIWDTQIKFNLESCENIQAPENNFWFLFLFNQGLRYCLARVSYVCVKIFNKPQLQNLTSNYDRKCEATLQAIRPQLTTQS